MFYFTNTELARDYHVSLRTVLNWIQAAKEGKLDIDLHYVKNKAYVANTSRNLTRIAHIVEERRKYRNKNALKSIQPSPDFYTTYNEDEAYDIIKNLEIHHEIPRQYNYFGDGARRWDDYIKRLESEAIPNMLNGMLGLFSRNQKYLDGLLSPYKKVNIIDIGVGNARPARELIEHFLENKNLGQYIAVDISATMLDLAQKNLKEWFGDRLAFTGYRLDIARDHLGTILAKEYIKDQETINLVLFLGGTPQNFRKPSIPLGIINDSMGKNDYIVHTQKLDSPSTRRYFDFNFEPGQAALSPNHRMVVDLLNIEEQFYDVEMGYDAPKSERYIRIRFKLALTLTFSLADGIRVISFSKGDTLLVWRCLQQDAKGITQMFEESDFYTLQSSQTKDQEYILTISRVRRD